MAMRIGNAHRCWSTRWEQGDPDRMAQHNAELLPFMADLGVEPGDIVAAFRQRADRFRPDTLVTIEPTVRDLEAHMLSRAIDRAGMALVLRDRARL